MEQTILQQRIEERAKKKLLEHLFAAANKEIDIIDLLGRENYVQLLEVKKIGSVENIVTINEYSIRLFKKLLPDFIRQVTDEILQKIDEIDYLLDKDKYAESE